MQAPIIITDEYIGMENKELVNALRYILTEPGAVFSFMVRKLNDETKKVESQMVTKQGSDLDEAELNLLVGAMIIEFRENGLDMENIEYDGLKDRVIAVLDSLNEQFEN